MERTFISLVFFGCLTAASAQTQPTDTARVDIVRMAEQLYRNILPMFERVEFSGSSQVSNDLRNRWSRVVNHFNSNTGTMAQDVMNLLVSPSGKLIDFKMLERFITVSGRDSTRSVQINMDFLLDEMKVAGNKITEAAKKLAETE